MLYWPSAEMHCLNVLQDEDVEGHQPLLVALPQAGVVALQDSLKYQLLVSQTQVGQVTFHRLNF